MNPLRKPFKYSFWNVTLVIVVINAFVFFLTKNFPNLRYYLAMSWMGLKYHWYWQPLTYMFVHGNFNHIFFNMLALICFGIQTEKAMGSREFLLFYFFCGIFDGIFSLLLYHFTGINVLLMGASGAIYALLLAFAVMWPRSIIYIFGIIPCPAPVMVIVYTVIELGSQLWGGGNVAHLAHLMGFALAWIYFLVRFGINPVKAWKNAWRR